ncbi:methyl-accepting chemotaxis protein [Thermospira aquatica]|uniref:CZB domain-containing protein n=1 Tax=Thermospira aquatica TaxID=2828656 RepID=A0AAX3BEU4_9SPIR|nr:methyl-accepting chemotaxis protein [Thermospira aquatica]URA10643.1 CZB domain-containing protein [Thermospira aquatica]
MRISTRSNIAWVILAVISLVNTSILLFQLTLISEKDNVVNFLGKQRFLSQQIASYVLAKYQGVDHEAELQQAMAFVDRIMHGLIEGDRELKLPRTTEERVLFQMRMVEDAWKQYKETIQKAKEDPAFAPALFEKSRIFLQEMDRAVSLFAIDENVKILRVIQISLLVVNLVILVGFAVFMQRNIVSLILGLTERIKELTKGHLDVTLPELKGKDEIAMLYTDLQHMLTSFKKIFNKLVVASNTVVSTVDNLRVQGQRTKDGVSLQAFEATQIATAAEEMSQTINEIANSATRAAENSEKAMQKSEEGKKMASDAGVIITNLGESTEELKAMVEKLHKRSTEIGDIVAIIKDIADQTNLLALNATIEAARAGKQGKGFAVVAEEVRNLAEKTLKATTEITEEIQSIQKEIRQTVSSMGKTSQEVTKVSDYIEKVTGVLHAITNAVQEVKNQVTDITAAVEEQATASHEVARNVEKVSMESKNIETMAHDVMHEVNTLIMVTEQLRSATFEFRTEESEKMIFDIAKTDHRLYVGKIAASLIGDVVLDPSNLPDHRQCRFGKWYVSEGVQRFGNLQVFKAIDEPHVRLHALAKEVVIAWNRGDRERAQKLYKEMEDISREVVTCLEKLKVTTGEAKATNKAV